MTEYYGNKLCISVREIDADDILTGDYRRQNAKRDRLKMAGRVGGKGDYTLAVAGSLPAPYPGQVKEGCPGGNAALLRGWILPYCEPDQAAAYFMDWAARRRSGKAADGLAGKHAVNAPALNACIRHYGRSRDSRKLTGGECNRGMMPAAVGTLHGESGHGSPANTLRFRRKVNEYKRYGCGRLISGKSGSQSARKTGYMTGRLS